MKLDSLFQGKKRYATLFFAGGIANLALAPFYFLPALFISFPVFIRIIDKENTKFDAFNSAWWFGFGYFVFGLYWICNSLLVDLRFAWMIPIAITAIPSVAALYVGVVGRIYKHINPQNFWSKTLALASLWTLTEMARSMFPFGGFPWNLIGYSSLFSLEFAQLASVGGVLLMSFIVVFLAMLPLGYKNKTYVAVYLVLLVGGYIFGSNKIENSHKEISKEINVRVVQPNIAQKIKWDPNRSYESFSKTLDMAESLDGKVFDLTVLPESGVPFHINREPIVLDRLKTVVEKGGALMTGALRSKGFDNDYKVWNTLYTISKDGVVDEYDKHHLVPFGEYVPFRKYLPVDKITPGGEDFSKGELPTPFEVNGIKILPSICYEIIFPQYSFSALRPDVIVNVTNDGWFGNSTGPQQHLSMARMRAIEQALPVIRAANTGVSAVIDSNGKIISKLDYDVSGKLDEKLKLSNEQKTIYSSYESYPILLLIFFSVIFVVVYRKKS